MTVFVDGVVHVAAPRASVWRLFSDVGRWPHWNPTVLATAALQGEPWAPGFRFRQTVAIGKLKLSFRPRVTAADPGTFVTWEGRGWGVTGVHSWYFEDEAAGTRVTTMEELQGPGLVLMRLSVKPAALRAMFQGGLQALKRAAEGRGG